jgi:hypothetical protein
VLATGLPDEIQRNQAVRDAYLGESGASVEDAPLPATAREPMTSTDDEDGT